MDEIEIRQTDNDGGGKRDRARLTDGQKLTGKQAGRQRDRQTERQTDRRIDRQRLRPTETDRDRQTNRKADRQTDSASRDIFTIEPVQ